MSEPTTTPPESPAEPTPVKSLDELYGEFLKANNAQPVVTAVAPRTGEPVNIVNLMVMEWPVVVRHVERQQ